MIRAIAGHAPLIEEIKKYAEGRIHSVFSHVANISYQGAGGAQEILSLVSDRDERFPWTFILDIDHMPSLFFLPGDRVFFHQNYIVSSRAEINLSLAAPYGLKLCGYRRNAILEQNVNRAKDRLNGLNIGAASIFERETERRIQILLEEIKKSGAQGDRNAVFEKLAGLIGLGSGLTPSGDDYLTSLMAVANMPGSPLTAYQDFFPLLVEAAGDKTNTLSATYLKRAAAGQVRDKLSDFIASMVHKGNIGPALDALLGVGSFSGRDLAFGVVFAFELAFELEK